MAEKLTPIEFSSFIWYNIFHKGGMFMDNPIEEKEALAAEVKTKNAEVAADPIEEPTPQNLPSENALCAVKKGPKKASYVFFVLAVLTFIPFIFLTMPFLGAFFDSSPEDLGEALGKVFGLLFVIIFMVITGIPNFIFSLLSTIFFGTAIGKTDPKRKVKTIVFFAISLALLIAVVTIALISFIVIKRN